VKFDDLRVSSVSPSDHSLLHSSKVCSEAIGRACDPPRARVDAHRVGPSDPGTLSVEATNRFHVLAATSTSDAGDKAGWHRLGGHGAVDWVLAANDALLRDAAAWVDAHPRAHAQARPLRTRAAADDACEQVLHHATRAWGATPLCRDAAFARMAADLPVFVRQCHGDRDLAALGALVVQGLETTWSL
jgi:hypothetical protein